MGKSRPEPQKFGAELKAPQDDAAPGDGGITLTPVAYWELHILPSHTLLGSPSQSWGDPTPGRWSCGCARKSSMAVWASSTDECPLCPELTWIFLWSRCLARFLSEALALTGIPAFWFSSGIRLVSRVLSLGWKYFRAWKSLWMACPTTILSFKIFRIWRCRGGVKQADFGKPTLGAPAPPLTALPRQPPPPAAGRERTAPFPLLSASACASPAAFWQPRGPSPPLTSAWAALKGMAFLRCPLVTPLQRVR
uniref:Uncharacterized protein n=1 Tax=Anser brachyrhynchus TaxID=132585 RepID=A0A8B9CXB5_9AVES